MCGGGDSSGTGADIDSPLASGTGGGGEAQTAFVESSGAGVEEGQSDDELLFAVPNYMQEVGVERMRWLV